MQAAVKKGTKEPKRKVKSSAVEPQNEGIELKPGSSKEDDETRGDAASVSTILSAREAWSKDVDGKQMMVVKRSSRPGSAATVLSQEDETQQLREERNVYIPYLYARNCIARMEDHMREMHSDHIRIVAGIQTVYKDIENDSSLEFKRFVFNLRDQYSVKLVIYRDVIEALRRELRRKEAYLEEVNQSLALRNQTLLVEQNKTLEKYRIDLQQMENDKNDLERKVTDLENRPPVVVTKEAEVKVIKDELETEKQERKRLETIIAAGAVGGVTAAAVVATREEKDDTEVLKAQIQALEEDNAELSGLPDRCAQLEAQLAALMVVASVADKEKAESEMKKLKEDEDILEEEKKKIEKDIEKWEKEFKKKNGRPPKESDKSESEKEMFTQLHETANMLKATNTKTETLRVVGSGGIPAIVPIPLPKVTTKTKVVKVRDHEIEAEVIRLRAELAAAKRGKGQLDSTDLVAAVPVPVPAGEKPKKKKGEEIEEDEEDKDEKILQLEAELEGLRAQAFVNVDLGDDSIDLRPEVDRLEALLREEKMAHDATREELESLRAQNEALNSALEEVGTDAGDKVMEEGLKEEIARKEARIAELEAENDALKQAGVEQLPEKVQEDYLKIKAELAKARKEIDSAKREETTTKAKVATTGSKATAMERTVAAQKKTIADLEKKLASTKEEAAAARKKLNEDWERKEARRSAEAEKKMAKLKAALAAAGAGAAAAKGSDQVMALRKENADLTRQLAALSKVGGGGDSGGISAAEKRKMEKILSGLEKQLETTKAKLAKTEHQSKQLQGQVAEAKDIIDEKDKELRALQAQLAALGVNAKEGAEALEKLKKLEKENKKLKEELATVTENFNSERVLRKKYYNMVEDMKGKIRVYCRARPMSTTEKANGNVSVLKSPDEYTVTVNSSRGEKEFNFDTIFMPEHNQEKVFEDTYNLVQSAFDGYNVCIFAYGQTGSGKTFTMIGDRQQKFPGIAPRAFERIFELVDENKSKFDITVSAYMLELYNDKLQDLFKNGAEFDDKLDIKKDKKGMVFIPGAEVKFAKTSKELYTLFDAGSQNRHVASTMMNAESSRSHLVIGVMIESTNKASGQVMKGKLSLVDLAGSERVAKTGATAQQLKEANSINKSLSALGDVISALSSDQQFIPYRNNKLTMLMQDSLGGNAKTLMFVNISPADYNADETIISLTYASRVKLITNDAQKNSDNKEIARLKSIIAKLKKGENVNEEED